MLDMPKHRVHVLAWHAVIVYPAFFIDKELHKGKAPVLGIQCVFNETKEPWAGDLFVHPVIGYAIAAKFYFPTQHAGFSFLNDTEQMGVQQGIKIDIIEPDTLCKVYVIGTLDTCHIIIQPNSETSGGGQGYGSSGTEIAAFGDALLCLLCAVFEIWDFI